MKKACYILENIFEELTLVPYCSKLLKNILKTNMINKLLSDSFINKANLFINKENDNSLSTNNIINQNLNTNKKQDQNNCKSKLYIDKNKKI